MPHDTPPAAEGLPASNQSDIDHTSCGAQDAPRARMAQDAPSAAKGLSASNYSANDYIKHRAGGADGEDGPRRDPPQPHT